MQTLTNKVDFWLPSCNSRQRICLYRGNPSSLHCFGNRFIALDAIWPEQNRHSNIWPEVYINHVFLYTGLINTILSSVQTIPDKWFVQQYPASIHWNKQRLKSTYTPIKQKKSPVAHCLKRQRPCFGSYWIVLRMQNANLTSIGESWIQI